MRRPPTTLAALWILSLACDSSPKPAPPGKVKQVEVEVDAKAGPRPGQKAEVNPEPPLAVKDGVKDPKDDSHVALPDSLLATGIPPIPRAIAEAVGAYSEARSATVLDWHPREHHLLISTRFADTAQVHEVKQAGGARRQLTFFRDRGRFPRDETEVDVQGIAALAKQLDAPAPLDGEAFLTGRTAERLRGEIRARFGFREATVADAEMLTEWLRDHVAGEVGGDIEPMIERLEARCRELAIEPPTPERMERLARSALRAENEIETPSASCASARFGGALKGLPFGRGNGTSAPMGFDDQKAILVRHRA